jgi:two-component system sensor histidine kinase KdpD
VICEITPHDSGFAFDGTGNKAMTLDPIRPNPDELLSHIQKEEQEKNRGRLKIFLGYAAGVGKTFAMLEAAHQRKEQGVDLVVGYVETHGRVETERLLSELEILPRKTIEYHGIKLTEMDADAILIRQPQLVLVDELAHTNAPGSRHLKRYQDVEDLLAAGSDVYTTLNIQHLESLNDVITQITGVKVRETIPDSVIDEASEIELVDLPPEELLVRLKEGKVYIPDQAARAIQKFFRAGNLTALRELTMRRAAERVDDQMLAYMQTRAIPGPWPAAERLLVCVSPSPLSERLVRKARRLADELKAEWTAVYVETSAHARLSPDQRDRVSRTLLLAEELGGKTITLSGESIARLVTDYARQHNFTKIIVGKTLQPRWMEGLRGSVTDQLARYGENIDVYIVSSEAKQSPLTETLARQVHSSWPRYLWAIVLVALGTSLNTFFHTRISPTNLVMTYLLTVVIAAAFLGRGPAVLASILSVLVFDFFFVPPYLTFAVSDTEYFLTFVGFLGVGLVISQLTARLRDQAEMTKRRAADTTALYGLSRDLAAAAGMDDILRAITQNVSQTFNREVVLFMPDEAAHGGLKPYTHNPNFNPDENENAVAVWTFQRGQSAGRGTDTLSAAEARYLPLKTARGVVGVLGVKPKDLSKHLSPEQVRLLEAFASQAALAIERVQLADQARQAQLLRVTEVLQTALLNSISHDLRTPLVSITGALSSLEESGESMDAENRQNLLETAREEADRLNRLVGNLLNMTRIEAGAIHIARELCDVQDVIGTSLEQVSNRLDERQVKVDIPEDIPLVPMDFVLIEQVLVNILDNAIKYSPPQMPIEVLVRSSRDDLEIKVTDRGIGIPKEDLDRVFDKFYRVQHPGSVSGTGLGLAICKGIIEAHGGSIHAENRIGGGTVIIIKLPLPKTEASAGNRISEKGFA